MDYSFSQAVVGFELACRARNLSPNTIADYTRTYRKFLAFRQDDPPISELTARDIEAFLASQDCSKKSVLNYFIGLSALWTWCLKEEIVKVHILRGLRAPRPEKRQVDPFTAEEIKLLLANVNKSRTYSRSGYVESSHSLSIGQRSRAIILILLDTGLRASELIGLKISDVDVRGGRIKVMGKGDKERSVPFGPRTGQALWKYLASRGEVRPEDPLFVTTNGRQMGRNELAHRMAMIGQRAGVSNCHPHRFRHTFAIMYLRNGGDPYTLQEILGHSTMEMVRRYLALSQIDLDAAHRRASPVENLRL